MLTLSSIVFHFLDRTIGQEKRQSESQFTHPFLNPRLKATTFPKSFQFLDFQWTPEGLSGQFKGVLSGLKPLDWRNLLQIDDKCFVHELKLKRELMRRDGPFIEKVTAGLDNRRDAQQELLELVLDNLKYFHSHTFNFTEDGLTIEPCNKTYRFTYILFI